MVNDTHSVEGIMGLLTLHGVAERAGSYELNPWQRIQLYAGKVSLDQFVPKTQSAIVLTLDQQEAFAKLQRFLAKSYEEAPYFVLGGYAGTGKTFLLQTLLGLEDHNFTITATNNKPTKVLAKILGRPASTVYSALKIRMEQNEDKLELKFPDRLPVNLRGTVLVVDEASMIGKQLLKYICDLAAQLGIKVIFVGDPAQLPPVGERRSGVWSTTTDLECRAFLKKVVRYDNSIYTVATAIRTCIKNKDYDFDVRDYADDKHVHALSQARFLKAIRAQGRDARVVCWRNRVVDDFNKTIRSCLGFNEDFCVDDRLLLAAPMHQDQNGESVIVGTVDDECTVLGVQKGEQVIKRLTGHHTIPTWRLDCDFDGEQRTLFVPTRSGMHTLDSVLAEEAQAARKLVKKKVHAQEAWKDFWKIKNSFHRTRYGFALTSHRVQGSTYGTVFVDTRDILSNPDSAEAFRSLYVAATRASREVSFN